MKISKVIKDYFRKGNVCVVGLKGRGKDILFSNVTARDFRPYISNVDYKNDCEFIPIDFKKLDVKNNWKNLVFGEVVPYNYEYPEETDIYISDVGVYFPSQYCNELNKAYPNLPNFMALSRQLGLTNVHLNCQNLNRIWDKLREQSDTYILCNWCKVLFGKIVVQEITIYDNADACQRRVEPFRPIRPPIFNKAGQREIIKAKNIELKRAFNERNGTVKRRLLVYIHRSKYDTRVFKKILKGEHVYER